MSYNIHHGQGNDERFDLERLAGVIRSTGADLVALQEVDVKTGRASGVDQAAELGRLTGMHVVFGEAMPYDGGSYGEAVLSRWPVLEQRVLPLPASGDHEPRAAVEIVVRVPGSERDLRFVGTHLDHTRDEADRLAQVAELLRQLAPGAIPTLLVGDLNSDPDSAAMGLFFGAGWTPADPTLAPTFPADTPTGKIDWILQAPGTAGHLERAQVLDEPVASDHCPFVARWVFP
jgi:endonuclease/exonuclease/phosphatase family metal-dependent hydrolase